MTRLGGFFIKRRLDSSSGKDVLYRKCLHEVIQVIIKWVWLAGHVTKGPSCTISAIWVCLYVPISLHVLCKTKFTCLQFIFHCIFRRQYLPTHSCSSLLSPSSLPSFYSTWFRCCMLETTWSFSLRVLAPAAASLVCPRQGFSLCS